MATAKSSTPPPAPMIAIGYARRSKESGAKTVSLAEQAEQIHRYAAQQDWTLAELVIDDGVSGGKRARLTRLEEQVRAHRARVVLVYHLDRYARDVAALLDGLRAYSRRGVELHVVGRGRVEADSASGFLVTGVEGLMAEHYRRLIGEKTRDTLAHLRAHGRRYSGIAPFGYEGQDDGRLVEHQGEQAILALVASLRGAGASWRAVCGQLVERGVMQRNGQPWSVALLHRVGEPSTDRSIGRQRGGGVMPPEGRTPHGRARRPRGRAAGDAGARVKNAGAARAQRDVPGRLHRAPLSELRTMPPARQLEASGRYDISPAASPMASRRGRPASGLATSATCASSSCGAMNSRR